MPDGMTAPTATAELLHHRLAAFNHERMTPGLPHHDWRETIARQAASLVEEGEFLERARAAVAPRAAQAPTGADDFVRWYAGLEHDGPGQNDRLFPWLAATATMDEMRWFLDPGGRGRGRVR